MEATGTDSPKPVTGPASDFDERRLWFDYITTLNERRLDAGKKSGLTVYGLILLFCGLVYRYLPQVPSFVAVPGNVKNTIAILGLQVPTTIWYALALTILVMYCGGEIEGRAIPESQEKLWWVFGTILAVTAVLIIAIETALLFSSLHLRRTAASIIVIFVLFIGANIAGPIWQGRKRSKQAKEIGLPIPRFNYLPKIPDRGLLVLAVFFFVLGTFSTIELVRVLKDLGWGSLQLLSASSLICLCCAILMYLFLRALSSATDSSYFALERDIVLDKLDAAEIKKRFLTYLAGPDMAQWFENVLKDLREQDRKLRCAYEDAVSKKNEIEQINVEYQTERQSRAVALTDKLQSEVEHLQSHVGLLLVQIEKFSQSAITLREQEVLERIVNELKRHRDTDITRRAIALCKELITLAKPAE